MLKHLLVDNYKCFVNFEIEFSELTLLLGPNGAGKSAVLDVIYALRQLLAGTAKVTDIGLFPSPTLTRWQDRPRQLVKIEIDLGGTGFTYRLEIVHDKTTRSARIVCESLAESASPLFHFEHGMVQLYSDDHSKGPRFQASPHESALARVVSAEDNVKLSAFLEFFRKILVCSLVPSSFDPESKQEDSMLRRDGSNFVAWYRHVFQERQDLVPEYVGALKQILNGFTGIRLERVGSETRVLLAIFEMDHQRFELRFDELSDGQRALMVVYALIYMTAGQGYSLFLDEPDNFVALAEIQPWLMDLDEACGEAVAQAVLCSHHPELIDYLAPDRSLLLDREVTGFIRAQPLEIGRVNPGLKLSEAVARGWHS